MSASIPSQLSYNGRFIKVYLILFILLFIQTCCVICDSVQSPCPNVFQYSYEERTSWYGNIYVYSTDNNLIQLDVELSVRNRLPPGNNGRLELAYSKEVVVNEILKGRPIHYHLFFPYWEAFPPRVTKILLNDVVICSGDGYNGRDASVLTTVQLKHVLTTNINQVVYQNDPPPPRPQPRSYGFKESYTFKTDPITVNKLDFKPQMPKDPTKIYSSNPFLNNKFGQPERPNFDEAEKKFQTISWPQAVSERAPTFEEVFTTPSALSNYCGRSVRGNLLVANGNTVSKNAYPWLVAIYNILEHLDKFTCGGTLISRRHIITAAHCLRPNNGPHLKPQDVLIALGRHNIFSRNGGITIEPQQFYVHEDYKTKTPDADVAIILLKIDVPISETIQPICLWNELNDLTYIIGQKGLVVGWGQDESADVTSEPKEIAMPVVSYDECHNSNAFFKKVVTERTFCAGNRDGSGPCNGDSGSGFMLFRNGRWTLRGIVSMSILDPLSNKKCDLTEYIVFTDIAKFSNWLYSIIR